MPIDAARLPTNTDLILDAVGRLDGRTDAELRVSTGVQPHQQVNQICHALERRGLIERRRRLDGRIGNFLVGRFDGDDVRSPTGKYSRVVTAPVPQRSPTRLDGRMALQESAVVIVPCSKAKVRGGSPTCAGSSVLDLIDPELAQHLADARAALAPRIDLDSRELLPAWQRYNGHFAEIASTSLRALAAANRLVILSGGYGILLGSEPIGWYERAFHSSDWPHGLLESCLVNVARSLAASHVVAFCSASTGYARLLRRTRWHVAGLDAVLVSPALEGRGGAMRLAPRTAGFALRSYLDGELNGDWRSVNDVAVSMEELT